MLQREQYGQVSWRETAMKNNAGNGQVASWTKVKHPWNGRKASHRKREGEVKIIIILVILSVLLAGAYLVTLGLWELREGINKTKYMTYMTFGLLLILVILRL